MDKMGRLKVVGSQTGRTSPAGAPGGISAAQAAIPASSLPNHLPEPVSRVSSSTA